MSTDPVQQSLALVSQFFINKNSQHKSTINFLWYIFLLLSLVNGGYSNWTLSAPCSVSCGDGVEIWRRSCNILILNQNTAIITAVVLETRLSLETVAENHVQVRLKLN